MAMSVWQDQGVDQFRDIAGRLASIIQSSLDRSGAMTQFTDALGSAEAFTDLMIEYSGRWFAETGGRSTLMGPELFWMLSEPSPRRGTQSGLRGQESLADSETSAGHRGRKLLLICVFEALAQSQWLPEGVAEHSMTNGIG
ncbi:hypothetical protein ACLMAJ_33475 [Nocardia sp. KC 131]|uniref:hypothetical protein n=1 Tax=Nocardia arseniciresistens TaxID=3392119 RepID=UPI00398E6CB1